MYQKTSTGESVRDKRMNIIQLGMVNKQINKQPHRCLTNKQDFYFIFEKKKKKKQKNSTPTSMVEIHACVVQQRRDQGCACLRNQTLRSISGGKGTILEGSAPNFLLSLREDYHPRNQRNAEWAVLRWCHGLYIDCYLGIRFFVLVFVFVFN